MNKLQAEQLLNDTFGKEFDIQRFQGFSKELFKNIPVHTKDCTPFIPKEFKDYITQVEKIGQYSQGNKTIEILAVKLARESSKERARTMQRNFIAKWLGKFENDAALVAFYDETEDWRFSFVKMEYALIEAEGGRVKAETELTPAKRYSYLVGKNEPNHTCRRQFLDLILNDEHTPAIEEIELAFSIENVTKEFFNQYKELFLRVKESLDKIVARDKHVREEFEAKNVDTVEFAKKLLGQIVFLYFLQKKGWLGVQKASDGRFLPWGTGPKNFMRKLFGNPRKCEMPLVAYNNFFNDILEPLFYQAIAIKRPNDYSDRFNCKIPFLNGGLFEALNDYDWIETDILIDNEIFEDVLDTFDEYNFTVKEDEPLEKEVAVDPEMLGKVFENLLEVMDRKSKGAFYTPREIVHYMCQQSLINYLETNSALPRKDIAKFINLGDFALDQTLRAQEQKKKYGGKTYDLDPRYLLPESVEKNFDMLDRLLREIKVVDPAVGSGAFPVGMMNEIVRARSILSLFYSQERKVYDLKRETIENSLYGVDIMPSAVEICKLRFWLSLIVDEQDISNIKPLPNLDHKIMCGNSLLEEFEGIKLFDEKLLGTIAKDVRPEINRINEEIKVAYLSIGEISTGKKKGDVAELEKVIKKLEKQKIKLLTKPSEVGRTLTLNEILESKIKQSQIKLDNINRLQKQFFNEYDNDKKKELKNQIDKLEWELVGETLKEQGNQEAISKLAQYEKTKSKPFFLWKLYFAEVFQREDPGFDIVIGNPPYAQVPKGMVREERYPYTEGKDKGKQNLYKLFIELAYNQLRENGSIVLIVQSSLLCDISSQYTRELLLTRTVIDGFIEFPKKAGTKEGQVFESVLQGTCVLVVKKQIPSEKHSFFISIGNDKTTISNLVKEYVNQLSIIRIYPNGFSVPLIRPKEFALIQKLSKNPSLNTHIDFTKQGDLNLSTNKDLIVEYNTGIKFYRGKHVHRYLFDRKTDEYMDISKNDNIQCNLLKLAEQNQSVENLILMQQITGTTDTYRLHACLFSKEKALFGHSVRIVCLKNKPETKFILALINSHLLDWFFRKTSTNNNVNGYEIEQLPIPVVESPTIVRLVDAILSITTENDYPENADKRDKVRKLEKEIDQLVYQLYELTPEEIKIVEEVW